MSHSAHVLTTALVRLILVAAVFTAPARDLLLVGLLGAIETVAIASQRPGAALSEGADTIKGIGELRIESIVQFLPTFCVVVGVLWLARRQK